MTRLTIKQVLEERKMTRYQLSKMTNVQYQTIDNYYKNKVTRYDGYILSKICEALNCQIGDILQYFPDET